MSISTGQNTRQINLNANNGAWTEIDAQTVCYYAEAIEDFVGDAGAAQGIEYQLPILTDGIISGWGPTIAVAPGNEPARFGDVRAKYGPRGGPILAQPAQPIIGSTQNTPGAICRMRSATGTATVVNFTEYQ